MQHANTISQSMPQNYVNQVILGGIKLTKYTK
jgi:hypothetical protein